MSVNLIPGREAVEKKGWYAAHKWLLMRRLVQLAFFMLFASGAWFGIWITKGTLAASLTINPFPVEGVPALDGLPLTDPLILLQSLLARHIPETTAIVGALIVLVVYGILGGRLYCSWVCPINPITDMAGWLRRRLGVEKGWTVRPKARLYILAAILISSAVTGSIAWELLNPITTLHRGLLFGLSWGMLSVLAILLFDVFVAKNGWCGHLCPVGAFYGLLNVKAQVRVSAYRRDACDDCMDCYAVCPEMHVISPALKGQRTGAGPLILNRDCTSCGRCIDVCPEEVFRFTLRTNDRIEPVPTSLAEVASGPASPESR